MMLLVSCRHSQVNKRCLKSLSGSVCAERGPIRLTGFGEEARDVLLNGAWRDVQLLARA